MAILVVLCPINIIDNEIVGLKINPTGDALTVTEGGNLETYEISLTSKPTYPITVTITTSWNQVIVEPKNLVFIPSEYSVPQLITITANDDKIYEKNHHGKIIHSLESNDIHYNGLSNIQQVNISDNDSAELVFKPVLIEIEESGQSELLQIKLSSRPNNQVTINLSATDNKQLSITNSSLIFSADNDNWNVFQSVGVFAINDDIDEGDVYQTTIQYEIISDDNNYHLLNGEIAASIKDNDKAWLSITGPDETPIVEGAGSSYSISLTSQPLSNVTILINPDTQISTTLQSILFTPDNWIQKQVINIELKNDDIDEPALHIGEITHVIQSEDPLYRILSPENKFPVHFNIEDNDKAGLIISYDTTPLIVSEDGKTNSYTIQLNSQPVNNVVLNFEVSDVPFDNYCNGQIELSPDSLTFNSNNWYKGQKINVSACDDTVYEQTHKTTIVHKLISKDNNYNDLKTDDDITYTIEDNDNPPAIYFTEKSIDVFETVTPIDPFKGTDICLEVSISHLSSFISKAYFKSDGIADIDKDYRFIPDNLSITIVPGSYTNCIDVDIINDDIREDVEKFNVEFRLEDMENVIYDLSKINMVCNIYSDDIANIIIDPIVNNEILENSEATYAIRLKSEPVGKVIIEITNNNSDQLSIFPSQLTFTSSDFSTNKFVKIIPINDSEYKGNRGISISHISESSDSDYNDKKNIFNGMIVDDDSPDNFAGYAIIAVTKSEKDGLSHTLTARNIMNHLTKRHFSKDNIMYLNPNEDEINNSNYQEALTNYNNFKDALENTISKWAYEKICNQQGPLYIILIGHGSSKKFYLDIDVGANSDYVSSGNLNTWINNLETKFSIGMQQPQIMIFIGSCYSGSFIDELSKEGRIIITSAAANEESYKGPKNPESGNREGSFFLSLLFNELRKDLNLNMSFTKAVQRIEQFTYSYNDSKIFKYPYFDTAKQHPLIDDDGDEKGENRIPLISEGINAKKIKLGYSLFDEEKPLKFISSEITPEIIGINDSTITFKAQVNNNTKTHKVWVEIRKPAQKINDPVSGTMQIEFELIPKELLPSNESYNLELKFDEDNSFQYSGKYSIFFFAIDENGIISGSDEYPVYKVKEDNFPPNKFNLIEPANSGTTSTDLIFKWNNSTDPDGDIVTYTLILLYKSKEILKKGIEDTLFFSELLTESLPDKTMPDKTTFSWKVRATDEYGAYTDSGEWKFTTENTNPVNKIKFTGNIINKGTNDAIYEAKVSLHSNQDLKTSTSLKGGYRLELPNILDDSSIDILVEANGYNSHIFNVEAKSKSKTPLGQKVDFSLIKIGDFNEDGLLDLSDAILCLNYCSNFPKVNRIINDYVFFDNDNENKAKLKECIYILHILIKLQYHK